MESEEETKRPSDSDTTQISQGPQMEAHVPNMYQYGHEYQGERYKIRYEIGRGG